MCRFLPPGSELAPMFQTIATVAPATQPHSTRHSWLTCALHLFARIFQLLTIQLIDSTFTGGGKVFTERGLKLKPGWMRAQFMYLEYRNSSLLNQCVHLLSVGCGCAVITLHHHKFFHCEALCTNCKQLCSPCEANFSKSSSDPLCRPRALVSLLL